jgi:hypothetical protein
MCRCTFAVSGLQTAISWSGKRPDWHRTDTVKPNGSDHVRTDSVTAMPTTRQLIEIVLRTWRRLLTAVTSVAAYDEEVAIRQQGSRCPGIADN